VTCWWRSTTYVSLRQAGAVLVGNPASANRMDNLVSSREPNPRRSGRKITRRLNHEQPEIMDAVIARDANALPR
jgi:hypothetical protein